MNFDNVLEKYRAESLNTRSQGDKFERLMRAYLLTDPKYANRFNEVWAWNDFPFRNQFGGTDTGIDLVASTFSGEYCAIQCKFYLENSTMDKSHVDSFITTSGRSFKDEDFRTTSFAERLWISTTHNWGNNAEQAIKNQSPSVQRINLSDLRQAPVDWEKLEKEVHGRDARTPAKTLMNHQKFAVEKSNEYFKLKDRGKLIMACGTGKTFTSLRVAENETDGRGFILFLVPSISLLAQTLREWTGDAIEPIYPICICSDPQVNPQTLNNRDTDSFSVLDLGLPASTDIASITKQVQFARSKDRKGMTVVFSTYQSIGVIAKAQEAIAAKGLDSTFDLIVCDEAHRTTGVQIEGEDESAFTRVHNNDFIKAKRRLYMTATPRLYSEESLTKAAQANAVVWSMDDVAHFGEEIYRIGFGEAVDQKLLTDYKVLVLTLSEEDVPAAVQQAITNETSEIKADDIIKLVGTISGLSKQIIGDNGEAKAEDPNVMKRAVAFCPSIKASKATTTAYNAGTDVYLQELPDDKRASMLRVASKHIDGTFPANKREECLDWLKAEPKEGECRVLTNVRCLSEGVDVPSLDAVMFLAARNSQVDVVQSVGRVMRLAPGKKYGYIIIPVIVPSTEEPEKALDNNERYKVVWTVLNALRAHDDRFNAIVNQIDLNKKRPNKLMIGATETTFRNGEPVERSEYETAAKADSAVEQLRLRFEELQSVVFARLVKKVGNRLYWQQWANTVAEIAARQIARIHDLIENNPEHAKAFADFLAGLRKNINPSISEDDAVQMLSQHIITRPVFDALFEDYSFAANNPVSVSMNTMLEALHGERMGDDEESLQKFYDFVRTTLTGLDGKGKQDVIVRLYENFFAKAFKKMVERLGIVYTPVEVVDFIIHSVNDVLKKEFGRELKDRDVHILDPFTGTGTFITRLIQSGLIDKESLPHKYKHEIFANEIVLLAYYIAAVNIENAYHDAMASESSPPYEGGVAAASADGVVLSSEYIPFEGICLTDTFQLGEEGAQQDLKGETFKQNSERVERQKRAPLKVIFGNPPYSGKQKSANDNAENQKYERLDARVSETYAALTNAANKNSLYNPYIKSFRWSTDRLTETGGIICLVTDGGWIDNKAQAGFRKYLEKEFSLVYVFNLRGNANSQGEFRRKESGNVFGVGSKSPIAITLLVKIPKSSESKARILYRDIGDYLIREDKVRIIRELRTVANGAIDWTILQPNEHGDWINQRSDSFSELFSLGPDASQRAGSLFEKCHSNGVKTQRDAWCYNSSRQHLEEQITETIRFYNEQRLKFQQALKEDPDASQKKVLSFDNQRISWSDNLLLGVKRNTEFQFSTTSIRESLYRPFSPQWLYFSRALNERVYQMPKIFPDGALENLVICVPGSSGNQESSAIISKFVPDLNLLHGGTHCFPLYYYEENRPDNPTLFDTAGEPQFVRRDGVSDFIAKRAKEQYATAIKKEDIFYYVYGFLHSPEYRQKFANDLKKMLPRIPLVDELSDFVAFAKAGRKLADLHLKYESVAPYPDLKVTGDEIGNFRVGKMTFVDKTTKEAIRYNGDITVSNIPAKAYEYVINGKSAIEWIMERYQYKQDPASQIINDPNNWSEEHDKPRYILDLLLSIVNVSVQTVDIVASLPKPKFE